MRRRLTVAEGRFNPNPNPYRNPDNPDPNPFRVFSRKMIVIYLSTSTKLIPFIFSGLRQYWYNWIAGESQNSAPKKMT